MKIWVKDLAVNMELGSTGITLDVYEPDGTTHRGDIRLGKATIEWCPGRTRTGNGHKVNWNELIEWIEANGRK